MEHYELLELGKILFDIKRFVGKRQPNGAYRLDYEKYHLLEESEMVDLIRRVSMSTAAIYLVMMRKKLNADPGMYFCSHRHHSPTTGMLYLAPGGAIRALVQSKRRHHLPTRPARPQVVEGRGS